MPSTTDESTGSSVSMFLAYTHAEIYVKSGFVLLVLFSNTLLKAIGEMGIEVI